MKRTIFFWLDKLKISRTERRSISYLLIILVVLLGANAMVSPSAPFDTDYYQTLDKQFRKRTVLMQQENQKLMARYQANAAGNEQVKTLAQSDTIKVEDQQSASGMSINVNTADAKTLQKLNGIGAAYAQRIVAYRQKNGALTEKKQLLKINGIGPARLKKIKPFITLGDSISTLNTAAADTIRKVRNEEPASVEAESDEQATININKANTATLQKLPGIGPAYAGRIVQYRQKNGSFTNKDELLKIKGIGKKRLANIKPFIKLKGQ